MSKDKRKRPYCDQENGKGNYIVFYTANRRTKQQSTGTTDKREADKVFAAFLVAGEKSFQTLESKTIEWVIDYYVRNHVERKVVEVKKQLHNLKLIKKIWGGGKLVEEIDSASFTLYIDARSKAKGRKGKPVQFSTMRRELNAFVSAVRFCIADNKMPPEQAPFLKNLNKHMPKAGNSRTRWLTHPEMAALLLAAQNGKPVLTPVFLLCAIAVSTGKRRRQIETLLWEQVDLENGVIDFREQEGRPAYGREHKVGREVDNVESNKKKGLSYPDEWLLGVLHRAYAERKNEFVLGSPNMIDKRIKTAVKRAKLKDCTSHVLRHTWGTWAAMTGTPMLDISEILGCTEETARKHYIHMSPEHMRKTSNKVGRAMNLDSIMPMEKPALSHPYIDVTPSLPDMASLTSQREAAE